MTSALILLALSIARGAEIEIAALAENLHHPGLSVSVAAEALGAPPRGLSLGAEVGGYLHPRHHLAVTLQPRAVYARVSRRGMVLEGLAGGGLQLAVPDGVVYTRTVDGLETTRQVLPTALVSLGGGMGWKSMRGPNRYLHPFLRMVASAEMPVGNSWVPHLTLQADMGWPVR